MLITACIPPSLLEGTVTGSDDPRIPTGSSIGMRLNDIEIGNTTEPTAEYAGQLYPIIVRSRRLLTDGSHEVQFELLANGKQA